MLPVRKSEITLNAVKKLEKLYPDAICSLNYKNAFELLIATRLSAQCTDARVNIVTPNLFKKYPDALSLGNAELKDVEELIKTCGLYKTKAKDLIGIGKMLTENYGGTVPDCIEELTKLPGVGRKTANLVMAKGFNKPAICVDVHVHRIFNRLGLVKTNTPEETEMELRKIIPEKYWIRLNTEFVTLGQNICRPTKPMCPFCPINYYCDSNTEPEEE